MKDVKVNIHIRVPKHCSGNFSALYADLTARMMNVHLDCSIRFIKIKIFKRETIINYNNIFRCVHRTFF